MAREPVFATPNVESLLKDTGELVRTLFRLVAPHLTMADDTRFREALYRFDRWNDSEAEFDIKPLEGEVTGYHVVPDETIWKRVDQLRVGDVLDLQGDKFADRDPPEGEKAEANRIAFESEYATVDYIERETPECVAVGIEGIDVFGMPLDHLVKYHAHNRDYDEETDQVDAEVHSDDYKIKVNFNAAGWFEQASDDEIRALAKITWGGDYEADGVAQFYSTAETKKLFDYVGVVDDCGYECQVNGTAALRYLRKHRPELALGEC